MSGQGQPPKPPAPTLPKKGEKKEMTKAELTRRVNFVADVLRRVYANNRADITSILPTTARGALQQQAVREYLRQPENRQLLNNIYSAREGVTGGTAVNLAMEINPMVYPQLFMLRPSMGGQPPPLEMAIETPQELQGPPPPPLSLAVETPQEFARQIPGLEVQRTEEEERPFRGIGLFDISEPQRLELQERQRREGKQQTRQLRQVQQELDRAVAEARIARETPGLEVQRTEEEERPAPEIGLFDIGEAQRLEFQERQRREGKRPTARRMRVVRPVITRPAVPQVERMEQRLNRQNQDATGIVEPVTANVPADPEQQILQEAQQGQATLPALSNNQEVINAFTNEAPEEIRPSVRNLIQGNVDADTVTDDVLAYVLNKVTGLPADISRPYITSLLDTFGLRVNQLTQAGRIPVQLAQHLTQYVSNPELVNRRTALERQLQNIYDASSNLPLQFRNDIRRISTLDYFVEVPSTDDDEATLEAYNQYEERLGGYQQRLLRAVQNNNANGVAGILNEMRGFYNGIFQEGILTSQQGGAGGTRLTTELADQEGMLRLSSSITPAERRREQVREIFRTSTGDELQRRIANLYQEITDEIAGLPKNVLDSYTSKERAINNIFGVVEEETQNLGQQVGVNPVTREQVIEAEERTQTARERAEAVRAGQTGAVAGAGVGAGVVGIGEVAAGILGSSVGAGTAGLVGGGLAGAGAGMVARQLGAGRGGQLGASVAGGLLAGGAVLAGRKGDIHVPGVSVREEPIAIPQQVVQQEEESKGKGTLRPKFIIPSASILDQTESQIQADMDEFAAFDYVIPTSEGAKGNIKDNPLKQQAGVEYRLRFDGAGVDITSLFGQPLRTSESELKEDFIGDVLDKLPRLEVGVMEKENLVGANIASPYRWDSSIQVPEYRDPYKNYTRVTDLDYKINKSQLYGIQY